MFSPVLVHGYDRCYLTDVHIVISNGGDTQSRNLYKKLVQVDLYKKIDRLTWFLVQVSCTEYSTALFRTRNLHAPWHVTRMVSSDWSTAMFSFCCADVVDNLLYKVNIVCLLIYF